MPRVMLAAAHKSSGKTTLSLGLCAALRGMGLNIQAFKKGPDYIDPMWLSQATGRPCYNLDFHSQSSQEILSLFTRHAAQADISVIEGNMGLFDSLDVAGSQSNAALAVQLETPVILVLDARGATRSLVPVVRGMLAFEPELCIEGLILNKVAGQRHEQRLREVFAHYCPELALIGCVHRDPALNIDERHLGLIPSNEAQEAQVMLEAIASRIASQLDLAAIQRIAASAPPLLPASAPEAKTSPLPVRIAIAQDAAFGFYYPDDLEALQQAGAELLPFDTLHDKALPEHIDGLFIGGGFPETQMAALAANAPLRQGIREAIEGGLPAYAECGGMMYLCRGLHWGERYAEMVGLIPADCVMHRKPIGRGYALIAETAASPWPERPPHSRAVHEFHYSSLENIAPGLQYAYRLERGHGIADGRDGIVYKNLLASYVHQRQVSGNRWVERFIRFVRQQREAREATEIPTFLPPFM